MRIFKTFCISLLLVLCCTAQAFGTTYDRYAGRYYTISQTIRISNPGSTEITNLRLRVPLADQVNTSWQDYVGERLQPQPVQMIKNETGGRLAVYHIPSLKPGETKQLTQLFAVQNFAVDFSINAADIPSYTEGVDARYLQSDPNIESDEPLVMNYAHGVTGGETNPYAAARLIFADIGRKLTYQETSTNPNGAVNALLRKTGNCNDYTYLFVASLRALGIPARWYSGYLYLPEQHNNAPYLNANGNLNGDKMMHVWAEVYIPTVGWVVVDPTYSYTLETDDGAQKLVDWNRFAHISTKERHILLNAGDNAVGKIEYTYDSKTSAPVVDFQSEIIPLLAFSPFTDLDGHWAKDSVLALASLPEPILKGVSQNYFGVSEVLTRAQLVTIVNRLFGYRGQDAPPFSDVASDHWASSEIAVAADKGYIQGYPDGTFHPEEAVSRGALAKILKDVANLPPGTDAPFLDLDQPGWLWAKDAVLSLYHAGLASGITDTAYAPQKSLTRGEGAVFIYRFMQSDYYKH